MTPLDRISDPIARFAGGLLVVLDGVAIAALSVFFISADFGYFMPMILTGLGVLAGVFMLLMGAGILSGSSVFRVIALGLTGPTVYLSIALLVIFIIRALGAAEIVVSDTLVPFLLISGFNALISLVLVSKSRSNLPADLLVAHFLFWAPFYVLYLISNLMVESVIYGIEEYFHRSIEPTLVNKALLFLPSLVLAPILWIVDMFIMPLGTWVGEFLAGRLGIRALGCGPWIYLFGLVGLLTCIFWLPFVFLYAIWRVILYEMVYLSIVDRARKG